MFDMPGFDGVSLADSGIAADATVVSNEPKADETPVEAAPVAEAAPVTEAPKVTPPAFDPSTLPQLIAAAVAEAVKGIQQSPSQQLGETRPPVVPEVPKPPAFTKDLWLQDPAAAFAQLEMDPAELNVVMKKARGEQLTSEENLVLQIRTMKEENRKLAERMEANQQEQMKLRQEAERHQLALRKAQQIRSEAGKFDAVSKVMEGDMEMFNQAVEMLAGSDEDPVKAVELLNKTWGRLHKAFEKSMQKAQAAVAATPAPAAKPVVPNASPAAKPATTTAGADEVTITELVW